MRLLEEVMFDGEVQEGVTAARDPNLVFELRVADAVDEAWASLGAVGSYGAHEEGAQKHEDAMRVW